MPLAPTALAADSKGGITTFPAGIDPNCRRGRAKIYDECADQTALFAQALANAREQQKTVLVSYGAEWCIWCHVFDQYVRGGKSKFTYSYGSPDEPEERYTSTIYEKEKHDVSADALALNEFVARHFVLVHIEGHYAESGFDLLIQTKAAEHYDDSIPFIFAVGRDGQYAAKLRSKQVETRRDGIWDWYRGYSRKALI